MYSLLWIKLIIRTCLNAAPKNHFSSKETETESHFRESTGIYGENVVLSKKILQIRPEAATALAEAPAGGNHSNYVRTGNVSTSGGNSKPPDPNTTSPDLFKDDGNETTSWNPINTVSNEENGFLKNPTNGNERMNKHKVINSYYEPPQKLNLDNCPEINCKSENRSSNFAGSDKKSINSEKKLALNSKRNAQSGKMPSKQITHNKSDPLSQISHNIHKATHAHFIFKKSVTKNLYERNISSGIFKKMLTKPTQRLVETVANATKSSFIYNPTILDSSDENYSEYEEDKATKYPEIADKSNGASITENVWQENDKNKPKIRFSDLPQREKYLIPTLKLEDGPFPFRFVSRFFSFIYPYDVPIGLLRDVFSGEFSFPFSIIKSVRLESAFLACVLLFLCGALFVPSYLACRAALALCARAARGREHCARDDVDWGRRLQLAILLLVMVACGACVVGMALSSENSAQAVSEGGRALQCACADLAAWATAAARDLRHALAHPADLLLAHYREDLANVESLLGEPIKKAITSESGIDLVLDSVNDITTESVELSRKITSLRELCIRGTELAHAAADRLSDLSRQLGAVKRQCAGHDAALCDTIHAHGLDLLRFELVLREQQLLRLQALGAEELTRAASEARGRVRALPAAVAAQTLAAREEIAAVMEIRRDSMHRSSRVLVDMVRHLSAALKTGSWKMEAVLTQLRAYDFWRWSFMLGCAVASSFVVALTTGGAVCGCANTAGHARRTLQVSLCWMCLVSLVLWAVLTVTFLIAGHAEVHLCRALWDGPEYPALSALLDRAGAARGASDGRGGGGMLNELFRELDNVTVDVPLRHVIRECEEDQPAYNVFRLERVLDINKATAYFEWSELQDSLKKLSESVDVGTLKTMSANLTRILEEILKVSNVNVTYYRLEYNRPLVGKDLTSLAEQLENVATQLSDLTSSSRVEALASRTRRLLLTSIDPLEQLRTELVYRLTELELQVAPFHRQLNTSLSHIRTMQYYIDNQGDLIANKKMSVYTTTLVSYTAGWRTHALSTATARAARCRPLYDIFSSGRALLCSHYIASLHGFWLCALCCAALWCYAVPCCLQLCLYFDRSVAVNAVVLEDFSGSQQEIMSICDDNWNTPRPPPLPDDSW